MHKLKPHQDWVKKYYPITAEAITKQEGATDLDLIRHSLQKWKGLRKKNLAKYSVMITRLSGRYVAHEWSKDPLARTIEKTGIPIDDSSCALCQRYYSSPDHDDPHDRECRLCPFVVVIGRPCTDVGPELCQSPWHMWTRDLDPKPMIEALKHIEAHYSKLEVDK